MWERKLVTMVGVKLGLPGWGIPLYRVLQNFELLNRFNWTDQIFGIGRLDIKNTFYLTKIRCSTIGGSPPNGPSTIQTF